MLPDSRSIMSFYGHHLTAGLPPGPRGGLDTIITSDASRSRRRSGGNSIIPAPAFANISFVEMSSYPARTGATLMSPILKIVTRSS